MDLRRGVGHSEKEAKQQIDGENPGRDAKRPGDGAGEEPSDGFRRAAAIELRIEVGRGKA